MTTAITSWPATTRPKVSGRVGTLFVPTGYPYFINMSKRVFVLKIGATKLCRLWIMTLENKRLLENMAGNAALLRILPADIGLYKVFKAVFGMVAELA